MLRLKRALLRFLELGHANAFLLGSVYRRRRHTERERQVLHYTKYIHDKPSFVRLLNLPKFS